MDRPLKTLPASFAQQRLWFLARLDPRGSTAYHLAGGLRLHGSLDEDALHAALDRIVERHEVLRTCLVEVQGQVRQRILEVAGFPLQRTDLGGHAQSAACVDACARDEAGRPFDLAHGPLIRGHLLRLDDQQHVLLVTMHHLVSDAWSMGVLLKELGTLYAAFLCGHPDPLPPLPVQYADYAIWQHKRLGSDAVQRHLSYWKTQLGGAPTLLPLPRDHPRPALQDYAGASVEFVLPEPVTQGLLALARSHRCSLFSMLLAAWALLLSRLSGEADLVIGTAVAGRTRSEMEPLIGLFVNTVALRFQVPAQATLSDWLQQVRDAVLSAQDHQDLPFERVVEVVQPPRALGHTPIYQVMFGLDAMQQDQSLTLPGLEVAPLRRGQDSAEFDLALSMQHHGDTLGGRLAYATALFDGDSMQRHVAQLLQLLQAIGTDANPRLAQLPWLPQQQRDQLLHGFNATEAPLPPVATLIQGLLAQVQRAPQATALIDGDLNLSYAQVWNRAACLAEHLQRQGLQPGQPVALLLPRSASLVIAQLAVLRCGACYVPMDPEQPTERLGQLLRDCRARLALMHAQTPLLDVPELLCLDPDQLALDAPATLQQVVTHPLAPAYVMYTSGSTGLPKGVTVSHGAVLNLVVQDGPARLQASDRVAFASNPAFDSATLEAQRTPGLPAHRQSPARGADLSRTARAASVHRQCHAKHQRADLGSGCRCGSARPRRTDRPRAMPGQPGLCHLHLRLHRPAQGHVAHSRKCRPLPAMGHRHLSSVPQRGGVFLVGLRCHADQPAGAPAVRRMRRTAARALHPRRLAPAPVRSHPTGPGQTHSGPSGSARTATGRSSRTAQPGSDGDRRRSLARSNTRTLADPDPTHADHQRIWPYRNRGRLRGPRHHQRRHTAP